MTESMYQVLLDKINRKQVNIGIIGLGYVGLPLAREFLKKNFRVIGFDIDDEKVSKINRLLKKSFFSQTRPWANKSKILSAGLPEANRIVFEK